MIPPDFTIARNTTINADVPLSVRSTSAASNRSASSLDASSRSSVSDLVLLARRAAMSADGETGE
jgi:hypothetical protein